MSVSQLAKHTQLAAKVTGSLVAAGAEAKDLNDIAEDWQLMQMLLAIHREDSSISVVHTVETSRKPLFKPKGTSEVEAMSESDSVVKQSEHGVLDLPRQLRFVKVADFHDTRQGVNGHAAFSQADPSWLNANALDYLYTHQYLIPREMCCKDRVIYFPGTVYDSPRGLQVRHLMCDFTRRKWHLGHVWLNHLIHVDAWIAAVDQQ